MVKSNIIIPKAARATVYHSRVNGPAMYELDELYSPDTAFWQSKRLDLVSPGFKPTSGYWWDRSRYQNHGTITGAVWQQLDSGVWVMRYDGVDDYVAANDLLSGAASDNAGSIVLWINFTAGISGGNANIFNISKGDTTNYLQINVSSDKFRFDLETTLALTTKVTTPTYQSAWHMLAVTCDGSTTKLYVDATLPALDTDTDSGNWLNDLTGLAYVRVGGLYYGSAESTFGGRIGQTRYYAAALLASQITELFNRQRHLYGV